MANPVRVDQLQAQSPATVTALKSVLGVDDIDARAPIVASSMQIATGLAVMDPDGFYVEFADSTGDLAPSDSERYAARNASNLASSGNVHAAVNSVVAPFAWDYSHIVIYGQSLSDGWQGWPALSKVSQYASNVMIGGSVRPQSESTASFDPVGGSSAFQPMVSVVQDTSTGDVMADADVAALPANAANRGETPVEGATNFAKRLHNLRAGVLDDASRVFVASAPGVGGKTIEDLSKGAATGYWNRLTDAVTLAKGNADGASKTYGIGAFLWAQGEWNYVPDYGGDTTKDGYKAKLAQLWSDFKADCVTGIAGQSLPPVFITYQTGGGYTRDDNDLAIGMAQWEFTKENSGCYLGTPVYPFTDKGGHLDPNGYRWFGNQLGKVIHRVVEQRQEWKPLAPRAVKYSGRVVSIDFHVPEPPLVFDTPYLVDTATDYANKGFTVLDDSGSVPVASVRIVFDTIVEITCIRDFVGTVKVRYADKTNYNGNGCLRDSDSTVANDLYEYNAGTGQDPAANIPALVGKPYPLWNWCIAFSMTAVEV